MAILDTLLMNPSFQFALGMLANNQAPRLAGGRAAFGNSLRGGMDAFNEAQTQQAINAFRQQQAELAKRKLDMTAQEQARKDAAFGLLAQSENVPPETMAALYAGDPNLALYHQKLYRPLPEEPKTTDDIREYEMGKSQGFGGTLQDWKASNKGGMRMSVDPATGAMTFEQGPGLSAGTRGQIATEAIRSDESERLLKQVGENYDPRFLTYQGAFGATVGKIASKFGADSPEYKDFLSRRRLWEEGTRQFFNEYRRYITGAAASILEMEDIKASMLNTDLSPAEWDASFNAAQQRVQHAKAAAKAALERGLTPGTSAYGKFVDEEMAKTRQEAAAMPQSGGEGPIAVNPQTGERVRWDGSQWVPAQ